LVRLAFIDESGAETNMAPLGRAGVAGRAGGAPGAVRQWKSTTMLGAIRVDGPCVWCCH
jgi:hypothetical protein